MLRLRTSPVTIVGYRHVTDRQSGQPSFRRDGSPIEMVQFQVDGDTRYREALLDPSINGSRAKEGEVVALELEERQEPTGKTGRDGRPFVAWVEKRRVVAFAKP